MAFVRDFTTYGATGATAASTHELVSEMSLRSEENDIICILIHIDGTKTCTIDGFTAEYNISGNGIRQYFFWKRVGSGEEDMQIPDAVLSSSENLAAHAWSVVGCPTSGSPIGQTSSSNSQSSTTAPNFLAISGLTQYSIVFSCGTVDRRVFQTGSRYWPDQTKAIAYASNTTSSASENVSGFLGSTFIHQTGMSLSADNTNIVGGADGAHTKRIEFLDANSQDSNIEPRVPTYILDNPEEYFSTSTYSEIGVSSTWKPWFETGQMIDGNNTRSTYTFSSSDVDTVDGTISNVSTPFQDHRKIFKLTTTGTLPAGLVEGYYWINRTSDSTIKLRSSNSNTVYANASNEIPTDVGSGTHTLTDFGIMKQSMGTDLDFDQLSSGHNCERVYVGAMFQYNSPQDFASSKQTVITGHHPQVNGYRSIIMVFMDSSNNWKSFEMGTGLRTAGMQRRYVDPASPKFLASKGTLDLANIEYYGWFYKTTARNKRPRIAIKQQSRYKAVSVLGGDAIDPMTSSSIIKELEFYSEGIGETFAEKITDLQGTTRTNIKIGDGTNGVYFKESERSFCYNALADGLVEYQHYLPPLEVDVNLTATDTFELRNCTLGASREFDFKLTGSSSATVNLDGSYLIGGDGNFRSTDTIDGVTFQGGTGFLNHNNATITNCTFDNINRSEGYVKITPSHNISSSTIKTVTASDYAIEIDTAGTYAFNDITLEGFTASLNPTHTSGTVTINVSGGSTPTLDGTWTANGSGNFTKGSATVQINSGSVLTLTNLQPNSEVRVYQQGTTTEVAGIELSGTSESFNLTVTAVDIVIHHLSFQNTRIENVGTSSNVSFPVSQIVDRQYNNP